MNHKKYLPGEIHCLQAVRQNELGVFLDAGTGNTSDDILLHKAQQTEEVKIGDFVKVGLYLDPKKRLAASMKTSSLQEGELGLGTVINITKNGGFVDVGAERGVFLPFSQMRGKIELGQIFFVKLYKDKSNRFAVTMLIEDDLKKKAKPVANVKKGQKLTGRIYNCLDDGWLLFTKENYLAFLHHTEVVEPNIKIGSEITGRVTFIRPDGRVNLSQKEQKERALLTDADKIIAFLNSRQGRMPYSDNTPPEIIKEQFGLSKAAFKRALGQLMKQGKISQQEGWTILAD